MAKECPACTSPNREEIERRLKAKESFRSVSKWLLAEKSEVIPYSTLFKHSQAHMSQAEKFADKLLSIPKIKLALAPSPQEERPPSDLSLPPLEALAHVQNTALKVADALVDLISSGGVSSQEVTLFNGVLKEARQAAKNRHELVHGKKYHITNSGPAKPELAEATTDSLKARREELLRQQKEKI